jgi:hypothetical protein
MYELGGMSSLGVYGSVGGAGSWMIDERGPAKGGTQ